jgi:hypothetical protein
LWSFDSSISHSSGNPALLLQQTHIFHQELMRIQVALLDIVSKSMDVGDKLTALKASIDLADTYACPYSHWQPQDVGAFIVTLSQFLLCFRIPSGTGAVPMLIVKAQRKLQMLLELQLKVRRG